MTRLLTACNTAFSSGRSKMAATWCLLLLLVQALVSADHHEEYMHEMEEVVSVARQRHLDRLESEHHQVSGSPFPCEVLPPSAQVPASVHALRPGDIKVVAGMGDSITAALGAGAKSILGMLREYRGMSWSIGGDGTYEEQETLPNILKRYNPELKGYSRGTDEAGAGFNVAVTGSIASELPGQARRLIDLMKADETVDYQNDWKVITIMTGGNDLCDVCFDEAAHNTATYMQHVTTTLDILKAEVPRAFVNLVETINVEIAKDLNDGIVCTLFHLPCRCAAFPDGEEGEQLIVDMAEGYHNGVEELVATGVYDTSDDFTVVVQPFLRDTFTPRTSNNEPDLSFFAPDCFHLSEKGHTAAANGLWNNMIEPEGQKRLTWSPGEPIECPTEDFPFFYTRKNSNISSTPEVRDEANFEADDTADEVEINIQKVSGAAGDKVEMFKTKLVKKDDIPVILKRFMAADDPELVDEEQTEVETNVGADGQDEKASEYQSSDSTSVAIGSTFLVLGLVGLALTILWTVQKRRTLHRNQDTEKENIAKKIGKYTVSEPERERY